MAVAPASAAAGPVWDTHEYEHDECDEPASVDMCTYYDVPDMWECEVDNALSASEVSSGYEVVESIVFMIKDPSSGDFCHNDTSDEWEYCAYGEIIVDTGTSNESRFFLCGIVNSPLRDARLVGSGGQDDLRFHFTTSLDAEYDLTRDSYGNSLEALQRGLADDDTLHGSRDPDTSSKYHETLQGDDGDDTAWGHPDDDTLKGGDGDDHLYGGAGKDTIHGGAHADTIHAGVGDDTLVFGGPGPDGISGGEGDDVLNGDDGNDDLCGDEQDDVWRRR